jgi:hypothetical protein
VHGSRARRSGVRGRWMRTVVPDGVERIWTRSLTWLTSQSPLPPSSPLAGRRRPTSRSSRCPRSLTSMTSARSACQSRSAPSPSAWSTLLVASSLAASARSAARPWSPAATACRVARRRTEARSAALNSMRTASSGGLGRGLIEEFYLAVLVVATGVALAGPIDERVGDVGVVDGGAPALRRRCGSRTRRPLLAFGSRRGRHKPGRRRRRGP